MRAKIFYYFLFRTAQRRNAMEIVMYAAHNSETTVDPTRTYCFTMAKSVPPLDYMIACWSVTTENSQ